MPQALTLLVLLLVCVWALRLFTYITWRNWGDEEDHRYQAMREIWSHAHKKKWGGETKLLPGWWTRRSS